MKLKKNKLKIVWSLLLVVLWVSILHALPVKAEGESWWYAPYRFSPGECGDLNPYNAGFVTLDNLWSNPNLKTNAKALKVTVSLAGAASIPAHIESDNFVGAGIAATSFDSIQGGLGAVDYGWSFVMYVNASGGPYFQMEFWEVLEYLGVRNNWLCMGYYDPSISISDQVTLTMEWGESGEMNFRIKMSQLEKLVYSFPQWAYSMNAYFPVGVVERWLPPPYEIVKYFQFPGAWSNYLPAYSNWEIVLSNPSFMKVNEDVWNTAKFAYSVHGPSALLDNVWCWGGQNYDGLKIKCVETGYSYDPPNKAVFWYTGDPSQTTPNTQRLWDKYDWPNGGGGGGGGYGLYLR